MVDCALCDLAAGSAASPPLPPTAVRSRPPSTPAPSEADAPRASRRWPAVAWVVTALLGVSAIAIGISRIPRGVRLEVTDTVLPDGGTSSVYELRPITKRGVPDGGALVVAARSVAADAPPPSPALTAPPIVAPAAVPLPVPPPSPNPPPAVLPASGPPLHRDAEPPRGEAAQAELRALTHRVLSCGPWDGFVRVTVTFAPSGAVLATNVQPMSVAASRVGRCISGVLHVARIPAFSGPPSFAQSHSYAHASAPAPSPRPPELRSQPAPIPRVLKRRRAPRRPY